MKRAGRTFSWWASVIGSLVWVLFALWLLLATTTGSRFVLSQVLQLLDGQLVIERVEGAIIGPLAIHGLRFENAAMAVELEQAKLDWLPSVLLFSQAFVHIEKLHLQGLHVVLAGDEAHASQEAPITIPAPVSLPVSIRIDDFELAEATLIERGNISSERVEVVHLEHVVATNLVWDGESISIPQLVVEAPDVNLAANVQLTPKDDWPLSLDVRYKVRMAKLQLPDASGHTIVRGSLARLDIIQQLDSPYTLEAEGFFSDPLTSPQWHAEMRVMGTQLNAVRENLPVALLKANITAQGNASQANVSARLSVAQTTLQVSGNLIFAGQANGETHVDLKLDWHDLVWPLDAGEKLVLASDAGSARVVGQLDEYRANVSAQVVFPDYPEGSINITGAGLPTAFDLQKLELAILGGRVRGTAKVDWEDDLSSSFELSGTSLDPVGILPGWPGQINFAVLGDASLAGDAALQDARVNLKNLQLDGVLRGEPVSAKASGRFADAELVLPSLLVGALGATLEAQGTVAVTETGPTDFQWQFSMDDLSHLMAGSEGSVQAHGRLQGNLREPRLQASVAGNDIAVSTVQIDHAEVSADIGLGAFPLGVNADIDGMQFADTQINRIKLDLTGTKTDHRLTLHISNDTGSSDIELLGSLYALPEDGLGAPLAEWQKVAWQVSVDELDIDQEGLSVDLVPASEELASTASVGSEEFLLNTTCFSLSGSASQRQDAYADQRLCTHGAGKYADDIGAHISLDNISLNVFDQLLPDDTNVLGRVNGTVSLGMNLAAGTAQADMSLFTSTTALQTTDSYGNKQTLLQFAPGQLVANLRDDVLSAEIDLPLARDGGLTVRARLAASENGQFTARALDANVVGKFNDIEWLGDFVPGVSQLEGELAGDLRLSGTVAVPNLVGNLTLTDGKATLPEPGLTFRDVSVALRGGGSNDLTLAASARSGGGKLSLVGHLRDIGGAMTGQVSIDGQRLQILNTPEAEILSSPQMSAHLEQGHLDISGDILIDKADIRLKSLPQAAATISEDQVIVGEESALAESGDHLNVSTRVRLLLNDAVDFKGFGLRSRFTGVLNLVDLPNEPTTATGEIEVVEGRYQAFGQDLTIEKGKLLFVGGPIDQPGIDVRAVRQTTPDVKVGVNARGNLRAPEFSIFSQPPMSQSDQLAYLVLGRPLGKGATSESSVLSRAALALGIKGGNYFTERYGTKLGVDKIGIEAPAGETNQQASLVVGKYLSPRLYVSYGVGILDAINTLKIEYLLSSKWRLSSESSIEEGGVDLTYTIER